MRTISLVVLLGLIGCTGAPDTETVVVPEMLDAQQLNGCLMLSERLRDVPRRMALEETSDKLLSNTAKIRFRAIKTEWDALLTRRDLSGVSVCTTPIPPSATACLKQRLKALEDFDEAARAPLNTLEDTARLRKLDGALERAMVSLGCTGERVWQEGPYEGLTLEAPDPATPKMSVTVQCRRRQKDGSWVVESPCQTQVPLDSGDQIRVELTLEQDAHVYLMGIDGLGRVQSFHPTPGTDSPLRAGLVYVFPAEDWAPVKGVPGGVHGELFAVVSKSRTRELSAIAGLDTDALPKGDRGLLVLELRRALRRLASEARGGIAVNIIGLSIAP